MKKFMVLFCILAAVLPPINSFAEDDFNLNDLVWLNLGANIKGTEFKLNTRDLKRIRSHKQLMLEGYTPLGMTDSYILAKIQAIKSDGTKVSDTSAIYCDYNALQSLSATVTSKKGDLLYTLPSEKFVTMPSINSMNEYIVEQACYFAKYKGL